jgi:hypothetical protein
MSFGPARGLNICGRGPARRRSIRRLNLRTENDTDFPRLSGPARRALSGAGYTQLNQLAQVSESEVNKLHGMGPTAVAALRAALHERGLSFRD